MSSKKNKHQDIESLVIERYVAEGKCIGKHNEKVIFVEGVVPGDVVDVYVRKSKKDWAEAGVKKIISYSKDRVEATCSHFGTCGGCKWQMLPYSLQVQYKQEQVQDVLQRIGGVKQTEYLPIQACATQYYYRNKLEFTFSNKKYLSAEDLNTDISGLQDVVGFHAPRLFDKVIDINTCHLMQEPQNELRNAVRAFALQHQLSFYDIKNHTGLMRNMMIRTTSTQQSLVLIQFGENNIDAIEKVMFFIKENFPQITSLQYTVNTKMNDSIYDQQIVTYHGTSTITERLENFEFIISAKSFFQTNTQQAVELYKITRDFAQLSGTEILYDLYCGTGSIGIFCSTQAAKIIGVESVADAIVDAKENAIRNGISHASFFAGDVIKICNDAFFAKHGRPDVIITDPPRAGMHATLIEKLLEIEAPRIVYVSCNPATQARDIALLSAKYRVIKVQAVDMFPHTHHVESVVLLELV